MEPNSQTSRRWKTKIKRAWCALFHRAHWGPHTGFGWRGHHCKKCGYMYFVEFEDWAK